MAKLRIIILVLLILIPISSALPQFPHKPLYCFNNCHGERGLYYGDPDYCGNCHELYFGNSNFKELHENKSCLGCHNVPNKNVYHTLHNISCSICHIDNTIPDNTFSNCLSCHTSGLHSTHLNKQCSLCHADTYIKSILTPAKITENISKPKPLYSNTSITNYKGITIYEILINLLGKIRDDITWEK